MLNRALHLLTDCFPMARTTMSAASSKSQHTSTSQTRRTKRIRISYLGPPGTYTHQAAKQLFYGIASNAEQDIEYIARGNIVETIESVLASSSTRSEKQADADGVQDEPQCYAVVPIANSTHGPVTDTMDRLGLQEVPQLTPGKRKDFICLPGKQDQMRLIQMTKLSIRHSLLMAPQQAAEMQRRYPSASPRESGDGHSNGESIVTLPDEALRCIQQVASHEQALGQCRLFCDSHLPNAKRIAVASTALAASQLLFHLQPSSSDSPGGDMLLRAAIASSFAAGEFGVTIVRKGIQDREDNTTQFVVLTTEADHVFFP